MSTLETYIAARDRWIAFVRFQKMLDNNPAVTATVQIEPSKNLNHPWTLDLVRLVSNVASGNLPQMIEWTAQYLHGEMEVARQNAVEEAREVLKDVDAHQAQEEDISAFIDSLDEARAVDPRVERKTFTAEEIFGTADVEPPPIPPAPEPSEPLPTLSELSERIAEAFKDVPSVPPSDDECPFQ